jgi:transposase-like protein
MTADDVVASELDPNRGQPAGPTVCPHCASNRTCKHGSFTRSDGSRQPRRICRTCGRTFNENTGTPIHYIKKRSEWRVLPKVMARSETVRRTAAILGVSRDTAFRWRHRLLAEVDRRPQPTLSGRVGAGEAYIRYSEKGSRRSMGPGARRSANDGTQRRFRRFIDGKPSCVLLACSETQRVSVVVGAGRPGTGGLRACLHRIVAPGTVLEATGLGPFALACQGLGVHHVETMGAGARAADRLRSGLYGWLRRFRGVATRYLHHYLAWHRAVARPARFQAAA